MSEQKSENSDTESRLKDFLETSFRGERQYQEASPEVVRVVQDLMGDVADTAFKKADQEKLELQESVPALNDRETQLAAELERVTKALEQVRQELKGAGDRISELNQPANAFVEHDLDKMSAIRSLLAQTQRNIEHARAFMNSKDGDPDSVSYSHVINIGGLVRALEGGEVSMIADESEALSQDEAKSLVLALYQSCNFTLEEAKSISTQLSAARQAKSGQQGVRRKVDGLA